MARFIPPGAARPVALGTCPVRDAWRLRSAWRGSFHTGAARPASSRLDVEPGRLEAPPRRFGEAHVRTPETLHEDEDHRVEECGGGVRAGLDEIGRALAVEREERHLGLGLDRRRARRAVQQAHLAEELARALAVQKLLDARLDDLRDEHGAAVDEEHLVARVALAEEHLVLPERTLAQ